jgi:hypothetical protein
MNHRNLKAILRLWCEVAVGLVWFCTLFVFFIAAGATGSLTFAVLAFILFTVGTTVLIWKINGPFA